MSPLTEAKLSAGKRRAYFKAEFWWLQRGLRLIALQEGEISAPEFQFQEIMTFISKAPYCTSIQFFKIGKYLIMLRRL